MQSISLDRPWAVNICTCAKWLQINSTREAYNIISEKI